MPSFFREVLSTWATFTWRTTCCGSSIRIWFSTLGAYALATWTTLATVWSLAAVPDRTTVSLAYSTLMLSFGARSFICGSSWLRSPITLMSKKLGFLLAFSQTIREVEPMASPLIWSWVGVMRIRSAIAGLATETLSAGFFRFTRTLLLTVTWVGIPAQAIPAQKKVRNVINTGIIPFIALGTLIVSPRFLMIYCSGANCRVDLLVPLITSTE